ncbi:MAG: Na+/H+ antiporter NhaA [Acidobacteriia bacterium]|nr:Na+/H+ antiporter NhaA [Methyloceanibacter sp.]MCL6492394.1 Na+/H+ antiporter NhaA [Terriglobia bacterium]
MESKFWRKWPLPALPEFLQSESLGGMLLLLSSAAAFIWANSPSAELYQRLLSFPVGLTLGSQHFVEPLSFWVNEGLMSLFFLLASLEIRYELGEGALASPARAALPVLAAGGGVILPAAIYLAFTWGDALARRGWAVPIATDIAFSLAMLGLLGRRAPVGLKVFLTALAIIDDLIAILVIAVFYSHNLAWLPLGIAALVWLALYGCARAGVAARSLYAAGGVALWLLLARSGIHPTLAGVALAFALPATPPPGGGDSLAQRLEQRLGWVVAACVLPAFGLVNAGLSLGAIPSGALWTPIPLGILFGLFFGKQLGVSGVAAIAVRLGLCQLPSDLRPAHLYGGAILCGIGFTMSLFIGDLAFEGTVLMTVKLGVFVASALSALTGLLVLALVPPARRKAVDAA